MAPIDSRFSCLTMALLLMSTTCLSSQVSETDTIGMKANACAGREPYQFNCTPGGCVTACKKLGCGTGVCHSDGSCYCS